MKISPEWNFERRILDGKRGKEEKRKRVNLLPNA